MIQGDFEVQPDPSKEDCTNLRLPQGIYSVLQSHLLRVARMHFSLSDATLAPVP